jgi:hypothetical protein
MEVQEERNAFSARSSTLWASKNVALGKERKEGHLQSEYTLEYSIPALNGVVYASSFDAKNCERNYTIGVRTDKIDIGYKDVKADIVHSQAADGFTQIASDKEAYIGYGLNKNVSLSPSVYVHYSTDLKQTNVVLSGGKDVVGGLLGYDVSSKIYLGAVKSSTSVYAVENAYVYAGASVAITCPISPMGAKSTGVLGLTTNYAYNTDRQVQTAGGTTGFTIFYNSRF